jgi:L-arabinokinase
MRESIAGDPPPTPRWKLQDIDPIPTLLARTRSELSASFDPARPIRISRAPGRLDVMGGIADYTGSLVCEATLDRAAGVVLQERADRTLQVFSFNLFDEHKPFTFGIPLDALATHPLETLRREFAEPGRRWAGYLAGCLYLLHEKGFVDLRDPRIKGMNLALYSTVPLGAGVSSSAAIEVATMMNLRDHFSLATASKPLNDPMLLASLCQEVENRMVCAPCGIMDQVSSCAGEAGSLLRMICQPHELLPTMHLPEGIRVLGINSNVKHSVGGGQYGRTRCAAFMAHRIILQAMADGGKQQGKTLVGDPMRGYLANLDPEHYKILFRPLLPARITGREFLDKWGPTIDKATTVDPADTYAVQQAADHHVLEARRVRNFVQFIEAAGAADDPNKRGFELDRAGHLMYASHKSYTDDALLGADECDLLVSLVRQRERAGLYGAKITGGGSGGTVAVLADIGGRVDNAVAEIMTEYEKRTGIHPEAILGTSPGAWQVGTVVIEP